MPFLDGPDCTLWVETHGDGSPVSVWAHGVTSSVEELRPMASHTKGTRVLFDFRGHGRSSSPEDGYDHRAFARDLSFVADRYGAVRAFGVSLGAGIICRLIAEQPDRFERLGFFMPASLDEPNKGTGQFEVFARALETAPLEEVADRALTSEAYTLLFNQRPQWRRLVRRRILRMNSTGVPRALREFRDGKPPLTDASVLTRVTAPALILAHHDDPLHAAEIAIRLADLLPNSTLRMWTEPLAMLDDPIGFARLVGAFMSAPVS